MNDPRPDAHPAKDVAPMLTSLRYINTLNPLFPYFKLNKCLAFVRLIRKISGKFYEVVRLVF